MENRAFGALAAALLLCCAFTSAAATEPLRVLYAEPFQAQALRTPGAQKPGPASLRVQAFGRTFELQLEDNSRLLRATSAATRARFGAVELLKGTIKDAPGSWVRLTLRQGRYSGAFWDGSELYAIAPREDLDSALLTPMAAAATGIYRLSDTQGGLFSGTCAVTGSAAQSVSPTARFRSLIDELRTAADTAFDTAPREIEISMVGDFEFTAAFGAAAQAAMLDRMNVVDGIFSSQVGVATVPTDFITFPANTDPFTSSEPSTLLNQLADYRNATPVVRSRGLAHLLTGRSLDGNTIGIAFIGSLCQARAGSGLTEVSNFVDSPLVIAHELGHNFGAPHDGEAGSPCVGTSQSFIMAPEFNFSSTFSDCSLQQMQPRIDAASCVIAARNRDLGVSAADDLQGIVDQPFEYVVDAASVGTFDALNAVLTVRVPELLEIVSASMPGAVCTTQLEVRCELGDVAPGASRRLTLTLRTHAVGNYSMSSVVTSTRDINTANDSKTTNVHVVIGRAVDLTVAPQPITATTGQPFELVYDVAASGALPLQDVRLEAVSPAFTPLAATADSGPCIVNAAASSVSCQLGDIAVGVSRRVRVQWLGQTAGDYNVHAEAYEFASRSTGTFKTFLVHLQPDRDIALSTAEGFKRVAVGQDATFSLQVASLGLRAVDDVHVKLSTAAALTLTVDGPIAASCTTVGTTIDCALGSLPAQTARTIQFRARADSLMNASIEAEVVLPAPDDAPFNDRFSYILDVRLATDVMLSANDPRFTFDLVPTTIFALVGSQGATAAENVHLTATLPPGFVVQSATLRDQPCGIDAANPHLVSCTMSRMEPGEFASLQLLFVAPEPGTRTIVIETTCDNDADPTNNSRSLSLEVRPDIQAAIAASAVPSPARTDVPIQLGFTIATGKYSVPDAQVDFFWFGALDDFSPSAPGAACFAIARGYRCEWPSLPANSNIPVTVVTHSSVRTSVSINASVHSASVIEVAANAFATFEVVVPGDLAVSVAQPTVTATAGSFFAIPGIDIVVLARVENAFIDLTYEAGRLQSPSVTGGSCTELPQLQVVRCSISDLQAPGTYPFNFEAVPVGAGVLPIGIRVRALNDFNPANDQQMLTMTIVDPTPPPPPPPPPAPPPSGNGGGGGGGGGSMSWLLAALLLLMWHHRRARSRVHR